MALLHLFMSVGLKFYGLFNNILIILTSIVYGCMLLCSPAFLGHLCTYKNIVHS